MSRGTYVGGALIALLLFALAGPAWAQDATPSETSTPATSTDPAAEIDAGDGAWLDTGDNAWMMPSPAKAAGGIRRSLVEQEVRIDFTQHALSALIRAAAIASPASPHST